MRKNLRYDIKSKAIKEVIQLDRVLNVPSTKIIFNNIPKLKQQKCRIICALHCSYVSPRSEY